MCRPALCWCSSRFNLLFILTPSLLRGAEQMGMHKTVKPQFGGGMRRFSCEEDNIYENIESELCFFTSQVRLSVVCLLGMLLKIHSVTVVHVLCVQERQSIIKYWLDNLRAKQGEVLHNIHFLEGQPISKHLLTGKK